jgi:hypothetical protein
MPKLNETVPIDELIRKAQAEPGLMDLGELSRISAEALQIQESVRDLSVVYMVSSTATTLPGSAWPLGAN